MLLSKPLLDPLAGWRYLLSQRYRQKVQQEWKSLPGWIVALQYIAGGCSLVFPPIVIGLLGFALLSQLI